MDLALRRRRQLRRQSTDSEADLWSHLRGRSFAGFKFRRQHPCGPFILDFFCPRARMAIELDGGQHFEPAGAAYDAWRSGYLARRGIAVVRFQSDQIFRERDAVLNAIVEALTVEGPSP